MTDFKNIINKILLPLAITIAIFTGILIGKIYYTKSGILGRLIMNNKEDKLNTIFRYVENNYVDKVSADSLQEMAIASFLSNLDPHSVYLDPISAKSAAESLQGNFDGIGVQFNVFKDTIMVVKVIENGPSFFAGILDGDRIVKVNDSIVAGIKISNDSVMKLLKGQRGSIVKLSIKRRAHNDLIDINIKRGNIPLNSIDAAYTLNPYSTKKDIGYIKITSFARNTFADFFEKVSDMKESGIKSLIIDLRENGGGYLDAAVSMIDEFFDSGRTIVVTKGKTTGKRVVKSSSSRSNFKDLKVVVLIDEYSASASEIFAGAIQDNDRGFIIGRRSFGKGLVQEEVNFGDGSVLRLTVSRYYTPSGRCIQKPYKDGKEKYEADILNRYYHGEFVNKDSIIFGDTTSFFTEFGRKVFGGGGIMPDIFIPVDTSNVSKMLSNINAKNLIYLFSLEYVDNHRQALKSIQTINILKYYMNTNLVYPQFWKYVKDNNVGTPNADLLKSKTYIENLVLAYIARQILSEDDFIEIVNSQDKVMEQAIKTIVDKKRLY